MLTTEGEAIAIVQASFSGQSLHDNRIYTILRTNSTFWVLNQNRQVSSSIHRAHMDENSMLVLSSFSN